MSMKSIFVVSPQTGFGLKALRRVSFIALLAVASWIHGGSLQAAEARTVYQNNFETNAVGPVPGDFLVIAGEFAIKEDAGNKMLELPGEPLDSFGLLFGPTLNPSEGALTVSARFNGTKKGRRYPTLAVGLGNQGSYRVQISPAKAAVEIYHGDIAVTNAPFEWKSGQWTFLKIQVTKTGNQFKVEGKVWLEGQKEPEQSTVTWIEDKEFSPGRPSIWASPFSNTPIQFDDFLATQVR